MKTLRSLRLVAPLLVRRVHLVLALAGMMWMLGITLPVPVRLVLVPVVLGLLYLEVVAETGTAPTITVARPSRTAGPAGGAR
ncbi:hypothetical protein ABT095_33605 [Kitasatospora sp. NPDC002227]|uniref:hypothetical protein n=1 Tax=Kitasatospora sp. NPDC002227 TaxID=3154773 RepID=UPI0033179F88